MIFTGWDGAAALLRTEVQQRRDEGCAVPDELADAVAAVTDGDEGEIDRLWGELERLTPTPDFPYVEPNDLDAIRSERPDGRRRLDLTLSDDDLLDRFHGAWSGRASGCALGKPVEVLGMFGAQGMRGRAAIRSYLEARHDWPLADYFSGKDAGDGITLLCPNSQRERIAYAEPDDDIHYTLIGLHVLEKHGADFQWFDVANAWNDCLPYNTICTAEAQAILNYNLATPRMTVMRGATPTVTPEWTRSHRNPYREWIGAQIRADAYGYAAAGDPEFAAELAWRDACWTHTANGIYGAMFVAAATAAAFVVDDPRELVRIGLAEIPERSRLAEALTAALAWADACADASAFMDRVDDRFAAMSPVHTINNAAIVVGALVYGGLDPRATACEAVMAGLDTDCNGATAGSIAGIASGRSRGDWSLLPALHDTIRPAAVGFEMVTMTELAQRTLAVHHAVRP